MLQRPLTTFKDFSETRQNFDRIPAVHVSYASSYLALLQCNMVEHPIVDIWEDLDILRFFQNGEYLSKLYQIIEIAYNSCPNVTHIRLMFTTRQ
jgi:hypothetical protein